MAWILIFLGVIILLAVIFLPRFAKSRSSHSENPQSVSMDARMREAAAACTVRGKTSLSRSFRQIRRFQKIASQLNALHEDERSPSAKLICENACMLQPQVERSSSAKKHKLPRARSGIARLSVFAKEYLLCSDCMLSEETLVSAIEAWSSTAPLTESEIELLPFALRSELISLICQMAQTCLSDQRCSSAARQTHLLKKYGNLRAAKNILRRNTGNPVFLASLFGFETPASWMGADYLLSTEETARMIAENKQRQSHMHLLLENAFLSLKSIERFPWREIMDRASPIQRFLSQDEVYRQMDDESQSFYRRKASQIAEDCQTSENEIGAAVTALCSKNFAHSLRRHCGYYLLDRGYRDLLGELHRLTPLRRFRINLCSNRSLWQTALLWLAFLALLCAGYILGYAVLMLVPIAAIFTECLWRLFIKWKHFRQEQNPLPRMKLDALPSDTHVLVICTAVLSNPEDALQTVGQLFILQEKLPDPQIDFLLLGDFHDSLTLTSALDSQTVSAAASAVRDLCQNTGRCFLYLQRERIRVSGEESCHGRDRKRGALETVLCLIRNRDIQDRLAYVSFDPTELNGRYRLVISLNEGMPLSYENLLRMTGILLHPLNRRQKSAGRFRGVSIVRPETRPDPNTLNTVFSKWMYSSTADAETTNQTIGLVDPEPFLSSVVPLPGWGILQSAEIDGILAGCATVSSTCLYHATNSTLVDHLKAIHLRTRGLWQLFPLLIPIPGLPLFKRTTAAERAEIRRKVLGTLVEPLRLLVMFYAAISGYNLLLLLVFLLPAAADESPFLSISALRSFLIKQMILPCTVFVQADAFGRALYRLLISHKRWMEWTPAIHQNSGVRQRSMLLFGVNMSCAGIFAFAAVYLQTWLALLPAVFWTAMVFVLPHMEQCSTISKK